MDRRTFLKSSIMAAAATVASPYLLPSGRLFARTASRKANHVVFCLFAGGVRNIESIHQNEGNLMAALLDGAPSTMPGLDPVPASPFPQALQHEGTLYKEVRYASGPTGHFNGHTVAVTGVYTDTGLNLRENPEYPTIFEYYLKHNSPKRTPLNAWWVSDSLGPYPALNYSRYPGYGAAFGANHISPTYLLSPQSYPVIGDPRIFQFHESERIGKVRSFLNDNFGKSPGDSGLGMQNNADDQKAIGDFIASLIQRGLNGEFLQPLGFPLQDANNDIFNILFAEEVIKQFHPELLVVNMTGVDICHQNFSEYCNSLRKADYAVAHLWNTIQQTPGMADDTVMIVIPEHGRNLQPNSIQDIHGRFAIDHTSDPTSREIFCLVLGPDGVVKKDQVVGTASNPVGESIHVVPTIANILGFDTDIPGGLISSRSLYEAFY
jgi:hypothetical protein